ncbi:MAG: anthranilate phosphoribosyltransferase [Ornithinimicrobium sp.]
MSSWPSLLTHLLSGRDLSRDETTWAMDETMAGRATPATLAAFLVALRAKGETVGEMRALSDMMLAHAVPFEKADDVRALDIVGTGGDGAHTVNISTMSAIVAAGAGVTVVKHGNRAASSSSGSADVLEAIGIRLDLNAEKVARVAHQCGITFCFAQAFHPSMRHAGPTRRELGVPTAFNFLGPLTNPAQPTYSAVGVGDAAMAPIMAGVFADRRKQAVVFRGDDGLDEVTPATTTALWWVAEGRVSAHVLDPRRVGFAFSPAEALRGQDAHFNAAVLRSVCAGDPGPVRDAVLLNAGIALALVPVGQQSDPERPPRDDAEVHERWARGIERAKAAIDSGQAQATVDAWVHTTQA